MDVNFEISDFPAYFEKFHNVRGVSLDCLYPHVVIHPLLHESTLRKVFGIIRYHFGVEPVQPRQMVEHIRTIVAQITNRIITIMWIIKGANAQAWQSIEVQNLLEITDPIRGEIQLA